MDLLRRYPVVVFFALTLLLSWLLFLPGVALSQGWLDPTYDVLRNAAVLGNFGPTLIGLLLTRLLYGAGGLRALLGLLLPRGVPGRWWLVALLLPIGVNLIAWLLGLLLPGSAISTPDYTWPMFPVLFAGVFITAGLAEEIGWRGFALPHLQRKLSALNSSLLLGVVWALWHLPAWGLAGSFQHQQSLNFPVYVVGAVGFTIVLTWLYNSTGGALLPVLVMHTATNASRGIIPAASVEVGLLGTSVPLYMVITWLVGLLIVTLAGPRHLAGRERASSDL